MLSWCNSHVVISLYKKVIKQINAERITSPSCQAAMLDDCTTVASIFVILLFGRGSGMFFLAA